MENVELKLDRYELREKEHDELALIISQQGILQQKVGVIMAIDTLFMGLIFSIALALNYYIALLTLFPFIAIMMNVYVLYPNFGKGRKSKYFYDFATMRNSEIRDSINNENVLDQIKLNSKLTKEKYNIFKWSLVFSFFFIPLFFELINTLKRRRYN